MSARAVRLRPAHASPPDLTGHCSHLGNPMNAQIPRHRTGLNQSAGELRWMAFEPGTGQRLNDVASTEEDPDVQYVELRPDEHTGPFYDNEGYLSGEFDQLHRWLGISQELYDAANRWNDEFASLDGPPGDDWKQQHLNQQLDLVDRLRHEVRAGISVGAVQQRSRTQIRLSGLRTDHTGHGVTAPAINARSNAAKRLRRLSPDMVNRIAEWVRAGAQYGHAHPDGTNDAVDPAWEDEGAALASALQDLLGPRYQVVCE